MIHQLLDRAKELCARASEGPWLEREDLDYYQGGTYLGTGPYHYIDGKKISGRTEEGFADYFENDVCRIEGGDKDKEFIAASRELVPLLLRIVEVQREALDRVAGFCEHDQDGPGELCDCSTSMSIDARKALSSCDELAAKWGKK